VAFGDRYDLATAFRYIAMSGYDGIELSAIEGMSRHLVLSRWEVIAPEVRRLVRQYGLELLAMEQPSQDRERMLRAFQAASELGIPVKITSVDRSDEPYVFLRELINSRRLILLCHHDVLITELLALEHFAGEKKVVHPPHGSKDCAEEVTKV
jgi:sugar phosphate isomerase/epimerase